MMLQGQTINDVWYFGLNAGISFSTAPPTALTNGVLNTDEGCAVICDNNGQLLFYTDGITVYNKNHVAMSNGSGLYGDFSSTQSAIIVPLPGSNHLYYIFTLDAFAGIYGICYSIVDITLNAGFGDVTLKNQTILTPASEKITVVKHSNNTDFWVVVHGWGNNQFHSYLLSSSGLNLTPVTTAIGTSYAGGGGINNAANAIGYMKVNNAGNMIAVAICVDDVRELLQFDKSTGVLSNPIVISDPDANTTSRAYAMEFSPDNHYLYVKNFYSHNVYQYDVSTYNQTLIQNSKTLVGTVSGASIYFTGAMQLGPDNKIYIAQYDTSTLAVINFPNNPAGTCGLVNNAISLNGRNGKLGLPCLVNTSFINNPIYIISNGCYNNVYSFSLSDTTNISTVSWNFGDPASGTNNTSILHSPTHQFSSNGSFGITAIVNYPGGFVDTLESTVNISNNPDLLLSDSIEMCYGSTSVLEVQGSWSSYHWSNSSNSASISVDQAGIYSVTATDANGCEVADTIVCIFGNTFSVDIDTTFCLGSPFVFEGQIIDAGGTYTFSYTSAQGCDSVIVLNAIAMEQPQVILPQDTMLCIGQHVYVSPALSGNWNTISWADGYLGNSRIISSEGVYSIMVSGDCGSDQDEISVLFDSCLSEIWFPNVFTPNGDYHNPVFTGSGINIFDFHMMIFNRWGQMLYESFSLDDGWDGNFKGSECSEGVYFWIAYYSMYENNSLVTKNSIGCVTLWR